MNDITESLLVSIIVRTKDRPKLLEDALRSIATQFYRPIEVVLVNDGGCDLDIAKLKEILKDVSLEYIRLEKNTGRANAGNIGIENSGGNYVGFLDDDDGFYPEHVSVLASSLKQINCKVAYTDSLMAYKQYDPGTSELVNIRKEKVFSQDFNYDYLIFENYIPFMCLLFEREVLIDSGGFDGGLSLYEDWDLLIRIGEKYAFHHIKQTTADYNQWDNELQIAQSNKNRDFMEQSYIKVLSKHINKVSAERILIYSAYLAGRSKGPYERSIEALLAEKEAALAEKESALNDIINSKGWKALSICYKVRDKLRPFEKRRSSLGSRPSLHGNHNTSEGRREDHTEASEIILKEREACVPLAESSPARRFINLFLKTRDRLLPVGTKRRFFTKLFFKIATNPKEVSANLTEQKLSIEINYREASISKQSRSSLPSAMMNRDYFSFLFDMNTNKIEDYVPLTYPDIPETDIKLIAFYLPQFHPIPENDEWWGKGFTEWANVARAVPQFIGHYQPRLPGELGFYDLRVQEVQKRQIELAKQYGVYGFCFHFYWFNGRTLLERPVKEFMENHDFPFCLNWANENWTRRWDGRDNEILIEQRHTPEDDIEFIEYISQYLKHKNYIRINTRPLLIIYRPSLLPRPKETAARWREWCRKNGVGEIYLAATHSFEHIDPERIGFDAVIDFPPNTFPLRDIADRHKIMNTNYKGVLSDYRDAVEFSNNDAKPPYMKFRGVCPSWDNEARKPGRGTALVNSSPDMFKQWLIRLCRFTEANFKPDERIIFINAWNEWAEGAYLEPDKRYGYAYLKAVADALTEYNYEKNRKKILYVCHDAHLHGAQLLSLNILKVLRLTLHYEVFFLLKSGGELEPEYAKYGKVYNLERDYRHFKEREKLIEDFYNSGIRDAICNTVASGDLAELFHQKGIRTITLVHELPDIIRKMRLEKNARLLSEYSHNVVFPSDFVREKFRTVTKIEDGKTIILPQGLYKNNVYKGRKDEAREKLRRQFSLPENARIILGVGFGDRRKGVDLFIDVAKAVTEAHKDVYFVWVGNLHVEIEKMARQAASHNKNIIFQSALKDVSLFYAGADIFLLTSREDPFPAVVLEAMDAGLPVVGFSDAGGFRDIVNADTGALVPYLDVTAMAKEIVSLLADGKRRKILESNTQKLIEENFNFTDYVYKLLALLDHSFKKVSVIIPNYNYERYLKLRINSVLKQTYPIYEIIFLDDASTDNSMRIAKDCLDGKLNVQFVKNKMNSGSAFKQWVKGLQMAKGDYVWIAEADDLCEDMFLEELMACFEKEKDVALAYCQSMQIDENGKMLSGNYFEYTNDIDRWKWHKDYIRDGADEISDTLVVKNTIPNVSAVVFRKIDASSIADRIVDFRIAGDWFFYVWLLRQGRIAYVSRSLNSHRRHDKGITKSEDSELHFSEVVRMQEYIMNQFNVPPEAKDKILSYRGYLKRYFRLNDGKQTLCEIKKV